MSSGNIGLFVMKKLVINADDLGFSQGVNAAISALAVQKRISSTSYMSYGAIDEVMRDALNASGIAIGLHFDLTSPLCPNAMPLSTWLAKSFLRRVSETEISRIAHEQLVRFEQVWQRPPAFIDGHQHVHQFPKIREGLIAAWQQRYPERAPRWRITQPFRGIKALKAHIIYALGGRGLLRLCKENQWPHNLAFAGAYGFDGDEVALAAQWAAWLAAAPADGGLIMCHPAQFDVSAPDDEIAAARVREWQWLASDAFGKLLQQYQIQVVTGAST